jgi:hypothetical protein
LVEKKLRGRRRGEVKRNGFGRDAELALELIGKLRELGRAARDQHEVVMVFGKELGQFVSDAAGGTGDEGDLAITHDISLRAKSSKPVLH